MSERIIITDGVPDHPLQRIHARGFLSWRSGSALQVIEAALDRVAHSPERAFAIDLVAHATPRGVLRLSGTLLDHDHAELVALLRRYAGLPNLEGVRLLGCYTSRGKQAVRMFAETLRTAAFGSTAALDHTYYDAQGFRRDREGALVRHDALLGDDAATPFAFGPTVARPLALADVEVAQPTAPAPCPAYVLPVTRRADLMELVDGAAAQQAPGLQAEPYAELRLPDGQGRGPGWYGRVEILFDRAYVRVVPARPRLELDGWIYRIDRPERVDALLASLARLCNPRSCNAAGRDGSAGSVDVIPKAVH